jgi:hypothetical protein
MDRHTMDPKMDSGPRTWIHVGFLKCPEGHSINPTAVGGTAEGDEYKDSSAYKGMFSSMYDTVADWIGKRVMKSMRYRHCEIAFEVDTDLFNPEQLKPFNGIPYNPNTLVAYGTNLKVQTIFRMPRTFEQRVANSSDRLKLDRSYEWIHLSVPKHIARTVIEFCEKEIGKGYDKTALERLLFLPKSLESNPESWGRVQKWHCTNFCVVALQQGGFLRGLDPNVLTADDVHDFLEDNPFRRISYKTPIAMRKTKINSSIRNKSMIEKQYS